MKHIKKFLSSFKIIVFIIVLSFATNTIGQIKWTSDGNSYYKVEDGQLVTYTLPDYDVKTIISKEKLIPNGKSKPIKISHFSLSTDQQKVLLYTNTKRVWRLNTKGDYWVFDLNTNTLKQMCKGLAPSSLMFAK
ncbi:MAG: S9 family peptidase, partial [Marinilabiliales bacterium]